MLIGADFTVFTDNNHLSYVPNTVKVVLVIMALFIIQIQMHTHICLCVHMFLYTAYCNTVQ